MSPLGAPPAAAAARFGDRLPLAVRYAELLTTAGVERGLLGPREADRVWPRHLLNCAALAELVEPGADVVDLGSGAGLPGLPLWLARPDLRMRLVEPMRRRCVFLAEAVDLLGAPVDVVCARGEQLAAGEAGAVVTRAVAPLTRLVPLALPLLRPGGELFALKGRSAAAELAAARAELDRWPRAAARLATVGAGPEAATVVRVRLGRGQQRRRRDR